MDICAKLTYHRTDSTIYNGVTSRPNARSIARSLLIVAHAAVVSMFPVIVAEAPAQKARSPSFVSSARPAARRIFAQGFI